MRRVRLRASVASEYGGRRIEGIGGVYAGGGLQGSLSVWAYMDPMSFRGLRGASWGRAYGFNSLVRGPLYELLKGIQKGPSFTPGPEELVPK